VSGRDIEAIVFDLDGVLVDSEPIWDAARRAVVAAHGVRWRPDATRAMMGMSSPEWSAYLHEVLGVALPPAEISELVVAQVSGQYERALPLLPDAQNTVRRLAEGWHLALASSSNRPIIEWFLDGSDLRDCFSATVSSEEVAHGKPAPDVYLEATHRLGLTPKQCVAVEDSTNGIRAAVAAGITTIAVPNARFPPDAHSLALATAVVPDLGGLTNEFVLGLR
jgi:HAD superfamily hydrolase (TIGR01509 family)